jgi:hypothetical protein
MRAYCSPVPLPRQHWPCNGVDRLDSSAYFSIWLELKFMFLLSAAGDTLSITTKGLSLHMLRLLKSWCCWQHTCIPGCCLTWTS